MSDMNGDGVDDSIPVTVTVRTVFLPPPQPAAAVIATEPAARLRSLPGGAEVEAMLAAAGYDPERERAVMRQGGECGCGGYTDGA